jgi:hypothetical protein
MHHILLLKLRQYQCPNNQKQRKLNYSHKFEQDTRKKEAFSAVLVALKCETRYACLICK